MRSEPEDERQAQRERIIGLGERSFRKSYYPQLRVNMARLERFRTLLDQTSDLVLMVTLPGGTIEDANLALAQLLGEPPEKLIGRAFKEIGLSRTAAILRILRRDMKKTQDYPNHTGITCFEQAKGTIWIDLSFRVAQVEGQRFGILVGRDVTERKHREEIMSALLAENQAILNNAIVGIALVRNRNIATCNRRMEEIYGLAPGELAGRSAAALCPSQEDFEAFSEQVDEVLAEGGSFSSTHRVARQDGGMFWAEITAHALEPGRPWAGAVWIVHDITGRKKAEERVQFLAYHDVLTGLPNRLLVQEHFSTAKAIASRSGTRIALVFIDLDKFKTINDSLGHQVGDALLCSVAARLLENVRQSDTLCRQGGDEFLLMLPAVGEVGDLSPLLSKLIGCFAEPFLIEGHELSTTVSLGVAVYPEDGEAFDALRQKADLAMYQAKDAGRNTYRYFDPDMTREALEQMQIRNGLHRALERREFSLHFQPQVEISSGRHTGAEALLRWHHGEMGNISPARFIPIAEDSGLIVQIGAWVLQEACMQCARWQREGLEPFTVAVNLSAIQFRRGDLEQSVIDALNASGLDPALLELELTESILITGTDEVLAKVRRLKHLGVRLSIDDFGTGYSSLAYLKRFAVDRLKIDQSFVRNLAHDPEDAAIVRAIVQMARSLGLTTIAEGVEDEQTLAQLHIYGCTEAQGYLFSKPLPAEDLGRILLPARTQEITLGNDG